MSEKIRVIIADDHTLLREGLRKILEMESDIEIIGEAVDGNDVVEKAMELKPDVVLMDVNMPHGGGLAATATIRKKMPEVNIVILTIHDDDEYIAELINAGAKGYILKDVEPARVVEAVRSVHQGNPFIPPNLMNKLLKEMQRTANKIKEGTSARGSDTLTQRELEVLELIVSGKSNREIADTLIISEKTVKNHVTNILRKLDLTDRTQAAVFALRHGLVKAS